jgi:hypothetical protein
MVVITGPVSEFLATYSADLEYVQHLSQEEQRALIAAAAERGSSLDREARNRLLEEYQLQWPGSNRLAAL